jgi:hypothetical protein
MSRKHTIHVLIVVDVEGALAGSLSNNVYLVDTNKHLGSGNEGQTELKTVCSDGQLIVWDVTPISPSNEVEISRFTGQMIETKKCVPQKVSATGDTYWQGRVESQGSTGSQQYSVVLNMDGKEMTFDPYIMITS